MTTTEIDANPAWSGLAPALRETAGEDSELPVLTPSDCFALQWGIRLGNLTSEEWMVPDAPTDIVRDMLAVAILAAEKAGQIRLEVVEQGFFFGWIKIRT